MDEMTFQEKMNQILDRIRDRVADVDDVARPTPPLLAARKCSSQSANFKKGSITCASA